ncbi:Heterokaryon incompatibility protein 6, OR allele [Fulvia fulva]|uniref:Heterokaryon incompatibility protein 6, OR allele n=1 Tax=Passalora fulva TaxID=5499 RepID=A0A9Q8UUE1_PASFU|nr:Heterokaryon incompatibility protein 6, OR allele [Fulvia fulva]KAK4627319.1 Heterokaryon incompatibility protein 6, OR allele [Fulvia fulva]KAK4627670.1 Heterokaryon incompatibility protein 6, OR allele [Fulvia fulva]UJO22810.1 Heterokaryon incompatibility protein 6, OR allele [Fulvia fulva]WPV13651.1 Heterokaryon incompatibility protein 6, OR allele [Fulvia fulva]WPV28083.1 Heterokaryon incompatibility protein 6, OR allele [Fulvia fulva]
MHPVYAEVPIQVNATRLLRLEPTRGDHDATVCCSLHVISLGDCPEHDALSYCWSDHTEQRNIKVNGYDIEVTSNLESALRHMRRTEHPRSLWVDALCINQQDTAERSSQVALMHEIYQKATRTRAWLGENRNSGESALEFLTWYAGRKALMNPSDVGGRHEDYETEGWSTVTDLMQRPYWRRLWVMQEIALSSSQPMVICGKKSISWYTLLSALGTGESAHYAARLNRVRGATNRYAKQESAKTPNTQGRHIIFLLSHSSGFKTTVPVDGVYALYGLLRVAGIADFKPDYTKSAAEVYKDTTAYVLRLKDGLDMLELRSHDQVNDLPSWVVDLSKQSPLSFPVPSKRLWERSDQPGAARPSNIIMDASLAILTTTGTVIDEVELVEPIPTCLATAFRRAAEASPVPSSGEESLRSSNSSALEYWARTADCGHSVLLCRTVLEYLSKYQDAVSFFNANKTDATTSWQPRPWDWKQMLQEAPTCDLHSEPPATEVEKGFDERYFAASTPHLCTLGLMLHGRLCFRAKENFIGVGLVGLQPGDKIVAFQSTKQLHVLRPVHGFHRYVGAAILVEQSHEDGPSQVSLSNLFMRVRSRDMPDLQFIIQ